MVASSNSGLGVFAVMPKVPPLSPSFAIFEVPTQRVAAFLKSPLTDEQLKLIGEISILWNSAHHRLQYFVWQIADWVGGIGALITADLQAVSLVILARNIIDNRIKNDFFRECAEATIDLFDELRAVRNKVIHGLPVVQLDGTVEEFSDSTAKRGRGLKITTKKISTRELKTLLDDIALLAVAIEGVIQQQHLIPLLQADKLRFDPGATRQILERAMMTPISHVQERQGALHRQHSSTDKHQPQPQP